MADDLGEKTELPTDKRRSEARERGQVARSTDLSGALLLAAAVILGAIFAPIMLGGMQSIMRLHLGGSGLGLGVRPEVLWPDLVLTGAEMARITVPLMIFMVLAAYMTGVLQVGFNLSNKALRPNLNRLNPIKGMSRLFSKRSVVKAVLDVLKLSVIGTVVYVVVLREMPAVAALGTLPLRAGLVRAGELVLELAIWVLVVLLLLGIIDFVYQRWQHTQDLKMTKHEVKDERKASEGDTEIKGRRLKLARQIAMQRIQSAVPGADVVVTNPTHFAVALRYTEKSMKAPRVVAKGADYLALKIRYIAAAHGVPIIERPPLARALYAQVPVGTEIHPEHYEAVAEVLAYVYRLEGRMAS